MVFQDNRFELLYRLAYSVRLAQNIDAVFILFNHFTNSSEVTLDVIEPFKYVLLVSAHACSPLVLPTPNGYGNSLPQKCLFTQVTLTSAGADLSCTSPIY